MNRLIILTVALLMVALCTQLQEGFTSNVNAPYDLGVPLWKVFGYFWPLFPTRTRNMSYDLRGDIPIRPPIIAPSPFMNPPAIPIYNRPIDYK